MRRYLLCAALDAAHLASDLFMGYCRTRAVQLGASAPRGEDLQFDIYEFRTGKVHTRTITWSSGQPTERVSSKARFAAVTRQDFEKRDLADGEVDEHAFKDGRTNVMSVTDIYDTIVSLGRDTPNTLEEVSIFSHAYLEGPILVNSYDDRRVRMPERLRLSSSDGEFRNIQGSERDPDDKDCRAQLDFVAPTMPTDRLKQFRAAFSPRGRIWIWGCNFDIKANMLLSVVQRNIAGRTDLGDDSLLRFRNLNKEQMSAFAEFNSNLKLDLDKLFQTRGCDVSFGRIRRSMWDKITASFVYHAARAAGVPAIGAIYGTYASFDQGSPKLMSISADTARNVAFYRNYFGFKTDSEGRNYGVFTQNMKISA
jgi:hypothetical protein